MHNKVLYFHIYLQHNFKYKESDNINSTYPK